MTVSPRALQSLAALVWYIGGAVLLLKGSALLGEANVLRPASAWPALATGIGFLAGGAKGLTLFRRSCHNVLERIESLERPRIWEFFRPRFLLFLSLMTLTGVMLSRLAHGSFGFLIAVGILDLSIGIALLISGFAFWSRLVFLRSAEPGAGP
jgi:hypothetical protein